MGLFNSLFGPSWADRVAEYMQDRRLPIEERIRLCILKLQPTASGAEIAQGLPVTEIKKYLTVLDNCDEMNNLAAVMFMRKGMSMAVVLLKNTGDKQWTISTITDHPRLPDNDQLRYRRYESDNIIIWNPVNNYGEDIVSCPR